MMVKANPLTRTTNQIQRNLMRPTTTAPKSVKELPFLMCRLFPFDAKPSAGIPDGDSNKKIVIDHRQYSTITVGDSGNFAIKLMPWLPHCSLIKASNVTNFKINGNALSVDSTFSNQGWWTPLATFPEFVAYNALSFGYGAEIANPYMATAARLVTLVMRITYVGVPTAASGTITVFEDPMASEDVRSVNNVAIKASSTVTAGVGTVYRSCVDIQAPQASLSAQTLVTRTDVPLTIRAKHLGDGYGWIRTPYNKTVLPDTNLNSNVLTLDGTGNDTGIMFADNKWVPSTAYFEGVTTGTSFRVETIACMEYQPGITSDAYRLARESISKPVELAVTQTQVQKTPIATAQKPGR